MPAVVAVAAAIVAAAGVPVGIAMASGHDPLPPPPPPVSDSSGTGSSVPSGTGSSGSSGTGSSGSSDTGATPTPPSGLTSAQEELWDHMRMGGVDYTSCVGYSAGEQGFSGVSASLSCTISSSAISEPIYYYQFDSDSSMTAYLDERALDVDRVGNCTDGDEANMLWSIDGATQGRMVCVDNTKDGRTYFKMIFSVPGDDRVFVVQDEDPSDILAWTRQYATRQFD